MITTHHYNHLQPTAQAAKHAAELAEQQAFEAERRLEEQMRQAHVDGVESGGGDGWRREPSSGDG